MPKKKRPPEKPETQFERFVKTAREHGVDESGRPLEDAFRRTTKSKASSSKNRRGAVQDES